MNFPLLNIFFTTMWVFLWILWIFLLVRIIGDLFRDDETSGWAKAGWTFFLVALPFVGVLGYLVVQGRGMAARERKGAQEYEQALHAYIQESAGATAMSGSRADDLAKLANLRSHGDISDDEYRRAKDKVLA